MEYVLASSVAVMVGGINHFCTVGSGAQVAIAEPSDPRSTSGWMVRPNMSGVAFEYVEKNLTSLIRRI
jgi:hypothetical protein